MSIYSKPDVNCYLILENLVIVILVELSSKDETLSLSLNGITLLASSQRMTLEFSIWSISNLILTTG
jgi:hypothetical protein